MFKASAGIVLPTSIIGSLPRPAWYTAVLGRQSFLEAMVNARYREQYEDAVSVHLRAQETAGLDICTDGDAHFDDQVGGMSWQSYPLTHMAGFSAAVEPSSYNVAAAAHPRGHILHDFLEARVLPRIFGPVGPGDLQ
jgi:5-methyltetrahydropteroyltriglutamate--homocysteine methyltransferase